MAIDDAYVWLMADKEVANRLNFESVESKEEFLVYLKNKKVTHNEFFTSILKFLKGLPQQRKMSCRSTKKGTSMLWKVERLFELQRQVAHTKADNVLKCVWTCKTNVYCTHNCTSIFTCKFFFVHESWINIIILYINAVCHELLYS